MRGFAAALAWLERATAALAATILLAMIAMLAFGPVQAALGLGDPIQWLTELAEYGLLQLGFLGAALALRRAAHPALDLLVERLQPRWRRPVIRVGDLSLVLTGALLLVVGAAYVEATRATGGSLDTIAWPKWPFYLCYPIGGALIAAFALGRLVSSPSVPETGGETP